MIFGPIMILAACENWFDALIASAVYEAALAIIAMKGGRLVSYIDNK
jgi:hypothetical protein